VEQVSCAADVTSGGMWRNRRIQSAEKAYDSAPPRMHSMPTMLETLESSASGPTSTPTPAMPSSTPVSLLAVSTSPASSRATSSVSSGVVAFSTEASPPEMRCWPYTISVKGMTLLIAACTTNGHQPAAVLGNRSPASSASGTNTSAARPTRANTSVSGGR
jgi:hypothetical protein